MIDEKRLIEVIDKNFGHTGGASVIKQIIKEQPKVWEWIPFNKKEPKEEGLYLCCFDDGFITTVEYEDGDWNLWADSGEVVAWQPLPEPLVKEKQNEFFKK